MVVISTLGISNINPAVRLIEVGVPWSSSPSRALLLPELKGSIAHRPPYLTRTLLMNNPYAFPSPGRIQVKGKGIMETYLWREPPPSLSPSAPGPGSSVGKVRSSPSGQAKEAMDVSEKVLVDNSAGAPTSDGMLPGPSQGGLLHLVKMGFDLANLSIANSSSLGGVAALAYSSQGGGGGGGGFEAFDEVPNLPQQRDGLHDARRGVSKGVTPPLHAPTNAEARLVTDLGSQSHGAWLSALLDSINGASQGGRGGEWRRSTRGDAPSPQGPVGDPSLALLRRGTTSMSSRLARAQVLRFSLHQTSP